nr:putative ribonuclease H-like domain-containing protein [Tanacetum cinerariifolium]
SLVRNFRCEFKDIGQLLNCPENGHRRENLNSSTKKQFRDKEPLCICSLTPKEGNLVRGNEVSVVEVTACNQSNPSAGVQEQFDAEKAGEENVQQYMLFHSDVYVSPRNSALTKKHDDKSKREATGKSPVKSSTGYRNLSVDFKDCSDDNINEVNAASSLVPAIGPTYEKSSYVDASQYPDDPNMPELEDITYFDDEEDVGAKADFTNLETTITLNQGGLSQINNDDFHTCMFACFLSQEEPKRVHQALKDPIWIEATQDELLQFKMQKVWVLVDLPHGKRAIGTKWVFRNKKDKEAW